jgi:hypothetical protein
MVRPAMSAAAAASASSSLAASSAALPCTSNCKSWETCIGEEGVFEKKRDQKKMRNEADKEVRGGRRGF